MHGQHAAGAACAFHACPAAMSYVYPPQLQQCHCMQCCRAAGSLLPCPIVFVASWLIGCVCSCRTPVMFGCPAGASLTEQSTFPSALTRLNQVRLEEEDQISKLICSRSPKDQRVYCTRQTGCYCGLSVMRASGQRLQEARLASLASTRELHSHAAAVECCVRFTMYAYSQQRRTQQPY
jgi:hypothetical protein